MQSGSTRMVRCDGGSAVRSDLEQCLPRLETGTRVLRRQASMLQQEVALEPQPARMVRSGFHAEVVTYQGAPVTYQGELVWVLVANA